MTHKMFLFVVMMLQFLSNANGAQVTADMDVRILATTSDDRPIPSMPIEVVLEKNYNPYVGMTGRIDIEVIKLITDESGRTGLRAKSIINDLIGIRSLPLLGYYNPRKKFPDTPIKARISNGEWISHKSNCVLWYRPAQSPTPMHIRRATIIFPPGNGPFGYDLIAHDLVAPLGSGKVAHLLFAMERARTSMQSVDRGAYMVKPFNPMTMNDSDPPVDETIIVATATGAGRGFLLASMPGASETSPIILDPRSEYMWPYEAPTDGFVPALRFRTGPGSDGKSLKSTGNDVDDLRFAFVTSNGEGRAVVGRVTGGMFFEPPSRVTFTYHFNPDPSSRSLEWSRNLFSNDEPGYEYRFTTITEPVAPATLAPSGTTGLIFGPKNW